MGDSEPVEPRVAHEERSLVFVETDQPLVGNQFRGDVASSNWSDGLPEETEIEGIYQPVDIKPETQIVSVPMRNREALDPLAWDEVGHSCSPSASSIPATS